MRFMLRRALACALLGLGFAGPANAQDNAYYRVTYIEVAPSAAAEAVELLVPYAETSLNAGGNQLFQVLQRIGQTNHFVILESWGSTDTQAAHTDSDYANKFRDALEPLLLSPPDSRPHSELFTAGVASLGSGDVFVVTHVDVLPPYTDTLVKLVNTLVPTSRLEEGNANFYVWVVNGQPNHMTVVEAWKSLDALERHWLAAHTRAFRSDLAPLNGALYDERLYQAL
jgi:quinol monooxygenase YgiN